MISFCQYSYFEFKIIDKVFIEGILEFDPPGIGWPGVSATTPSIFTLDWSTLTRLTNWAPFREVPGSQLQWSLTIYFPARSGPAGVALAF